MKPIHLFTPLYRYSGYPKTSVDVKIGHVRYDLILPAEISDEILTHFIHSDDSYRRFDHYCSPEGIEKVRAQPAVLGDDYEFAPNYAVSFNGVEDTQDDDAVIGYVALRLAVGALAAKRLYNRACRRDFITKKLADYIMSRDAYFKHCGGFELLRIRYYFDAEDRYSVMLDLEADEPPLAPPFKESRGRKPRFRDMP